MAYIEGLLIGCGLDVRQQAWVKIAVIEYGSLCAQRGITDMAERVRKITTGEN